MPYSYTKRGKHFNTGSKVSNPTGTFLAIFGMAIMDMLRLTPDEYDFIVEKMSDEEIDLIVNEKPNFSEKRKILTLLTKYINDYENSRL